MISRAPWTEQEIRSLEMRQADHGLHSYTCHVCSSVLVPRQEGWYCNVCEMGVQDWAHLSDTGQVADGAGAPTPEEMESLSSLASALRERVS